MTFAVGDHVKLAHPVGGYSGTLRRCQRVLGTRLWRVALDRPYAGLRSLSVWDRHLRPDSWDTRALVAGQRVRVTAIGINGREGTLVRPARLLWKQAWLVDFGPGGVLRRTRVADTALAPVDT